MPLPFSKQSYEQASMLVGAPKFVMLDTATMGQLANRPREETSKELLACFRSGDWVPYLTWHHLEELFSHANDDVFRRRVDLIAKLPHVAYVKQSQHTSEPYSGSVLDIRDYELKFLLANPGAAHSAIDDAVWPSARGNFCTGEQFVENNFQWWRIFRRFLALPTRLRKEEVANITHFFTTDPNEPLPLNDGSWSVLSPEGSAKRLAEMAAKLERQINEFGDSRHINLRTATAKFMREVHKESLPLLSKGPDFIEAMMQRDGVSRERLPPLPTVGDMGYEAVFVGQLRVHARRLLISHDELVR